jgi:AcrR family transcriptional regulator
MRGIAREAHVDPALVHHFFLSKEGVFAAATRDAVDLSERIPEILGSDREGVGERLVRLFLSLWEGAAQDKTFLGIIRSAMSHEESARMLREFVSTEGLGRLARAMEQPEPELRASLIGSQLVGLAVMRYVVKVRPLASLGTEDVVAAVAPTVQRYLTEDIGRLRGAAGSGVAGPVLGSGADSGPHPAGTF